MATNKTASSPTSAIAAKLSLGAAIVFLVVLVLLHVIEPEYGPMWRFMSEYSNGQYGWLMRLGFFTLAFSALALIPAIRSQVHSKAGKVGVAFLGVTAAGMILAGCFNQDSITSTVTTMTGNMHGVATLLGIPGFMIASLLIGISLARHNKAWAQVRGSLLWLSNLGWMSFAAMLVYMMIAVPQAGGFGPDVWVGLLNRVFVLAMCAWLAFVSYQVLKQQKTN